MLIVALMLVLFANHMVSCHPVPVSPLICIPVALCGAHAPALYIVCTTVLVLSKCGDEPEYTHWAGGTQTCSIMLRHICI